MQDERLVEERSIINELGMVLPGVLQRKCHRDQLVASKVESCQMILFGQGSQRNVSFWTQLLHTFPRNQ